MGLLTVSRHICGGITPTSFLEGVLISLILLTVQLPNSAHGFTSFYKPQTNFGKFHGGEFVPM